MKFAVKRKGELVFARSPKNGESWDMRPRFVKTPEGKYVFGMIGYKGEELIDSADLGMTVGSVAHKNKQIVAAEIEDLVLDRLDIALDSEVVYIIK